MKRFTDMRAFLLPLLLLAAPARAAVSPPSGSNNELLTAETRRHVSEAIKKLMEEKCPQHCEVGEISVKVSQRKPPAGTMPGFEELTPGVKDFVVDKVDVNVMLDKRLTGDFRAGVRTIIAKKLEAEGIQNVVHEQLIHFPSPDEVPEKPPVMPQYPSPPREKAEPEKKPEVAGPVQYLPLPERSAWDRFLDQLPLLLGLLLCAGVVWFTLRQYQRVLEARTAARRREEVKAAKEEAAIAASQQAAKPPTPQEARRELERSVESLKARLGESRPLAREVMKDLVQHGAPADVALAVVLLGPAVLDGVRGDPECKAGLGAVDDYLAERAPEDTPEARRRVIADLERRALRVQVARGAEPADTAFAFLRDVSPALFVRLLADESPESQAIILRQAPAPLVQAFLERQPPAERERLVRPLLESAAATHESLSRLAESFRDRLSRYAVLESHVDPVGDLLQAATPAERARMLAALTGDPEATRRALGSFVAEPTMAAMDGDVLATALARVDVTTAALFVGSLDDKSRKRVLAALPAVTARSVAEEAEVLTAAPARRVAARKSVFEAIRRAAFERGLDLAEMNRRALSTAEEVAS